MHIYAYICLYMPMFGELLVVCSLFGPNGIDRSPRSHAVNSSFARTRPSPPPVCTTVSRGLRGSTKPSSRVQATAASTTSSAKPRPILSEKGAAGQTPTSKNSRIAGYPREEAPAPTAAPSPSRLNASASYQEKFDSCIRSRSRTSSPWRPVLRSSKRRSGSTERREARGS